ncbi:AAA family ATPase [Bacteroidales bacterium OttesenSCG-928-K03]|nr:AAA family ATPase [Bacteroidales bacterium OttesenSCG-928-K03]
MSNSFINNIIDKAPFTHTNDQLNCLKNISKYLFEDFERGIHIINGYAGTGKTTLVSEIVEELRELKYKVTLLAPTGRAAKVLSNYCNYPAFTIHKHIYLSYRNELGDFKIILAKNKSPNTIFFIDEASMIADNSSSNDFSYRNLLDDVINFVFSQPNCKLIIIGDTAQLPPVGFAESPALIPKTYQDKFSLPAGISNLTQVVRQTQDSPILANASFLRDKIVNEEFSEPLFKEFDNKFFCEVKSYDLEDALNNSFGNYHSDKESIIVCRSNKRANLYNKAVKTRILFHDNMLVSGEKLMVIKNNYFWLDETKEAQFIANGEMIEIMRINKIENLYDFNFAHVSVRLYDFPDSPILDVILLLDTLDIDTASQSFEERTKLYNNIMEDYMHIASKRERHKAIKLDPYYNALQVKYGYAMTCHKAQGGQWDSIFIDLGFFKEEMLDKEYLRWLYTAVTRAKENVYVVR